MFYKNYFPHGVVSLPLYIYVMSILIGFIFGAAVFATLVVLVIGIISFAMNGPFYQKNANQLMRLRVFFQGLAILLLGLSVWLMGNE